MERKLKCKALVRLQWQIQRGALGARAPPRPLIKLTSGQKKKENLIFSTFWNNQCLDSMGLFGIKIKAIEFSFSPND